MPTFEETRLQHALDSLRESEARYRSVVAALSEGIVLQAADGSILACNPAAETILGMSVDQMAGRTSLDPRWRAIHRDGSEFAGETHPAMVTLRTGEPQHNVSMGVHKPDGTLTWISINTQPLIREGERSPYAVVASFTDVTELVRGQEALERSARQLRLALASARAGVWEWDIASNEVWWSEGVEGMFGLGSGEFDGTYERYIALILPRDRERVLATIQAALAPESSGRYEIEHRIQHSGQHERWIYASGSVLRDDKGAPRGMTGAVLDITHLKHMEQRLLHAQKMESVGRLAGGVAHDFNNLLTAVLVSAEFAREELDAGAELSTIRELLDDIHHAAEHGSRLTRQLLSFARKQVLTLAPLRVGDVVRGCQTLLSRLLGDHIVLEIACSDTALVECDEGQLEQVIVNLVVNARDAMPSGGTLRVMVRDVELDADVARDSARPGPHVELQVSDTGNGIAPELLENVFEPFFTTKRDGTGLGLATCHGVVNQLGGHMALTSELGVGTRVTAYLPTTGGAAVSEPTPQPRARQRGRETILLVEDEPLVRQVTRRALTNEGYEVFEAAGPAEALELVRTCGRRIELLISDIQMPGMSGVELARTLVAAQPDLHVLLVSGYTKQHGELSVGARGLQFLQKPYAVAELSRRIREILDS